MKVVLVILCILSSLSSQAFSCRSNKVMGTYAIPATSVTTPPIYTFFSGMIFNSERDPLNKQDRNIKNIISYSSMAVGLSFVFFGDSACPGISHESYKKLVRERKELIANGEDVSKLKPLPVIPSPKELKSLITSWKKRQLKLRRYFSPLSFALQTSIAIKADKFGTKALASLSALGTLALVIFDVDNLRNDKDPYWADFSILPVAINNRVYPSPTISLIF